HFDRSFFIVIALQDGDVLSDDMLHRIEALSSRISSIDGVGGVVSPATLSDITIEDEVLAYSRVPITEAARVVAETPLFRKMLLSEKADAVTLLVIPKNRDRDVEVSEQVVNIIESGEFGEMYILGYPVVSYFVDIGTQSDFYLLTAIAAGVMLLAFILIAKKIGTGLLLWISSVLPALWTTALFPLCNVEMRITGILVPVLTLGLATTYSIHLFRYARTDHELGRDAVLRGAAPIIGAAALTTMLGFATLLISPEPELRSLGLFIICGIVFAVLSSLFFLPALLYPGGNQTVNFSAVRTRGIRVGSGNTRIPAVLIIGAVIATAAGAYRIHSDYRIENMFRPSHPLVENAGYFNQTYGGIEEIEILIDTGQEYGLVYPDIYGSIRRIAADLENLDRVNHVLSIVDFVDWANGRLAGLQEPLAPQSEVEIGEVLELLSGGEAGLSLESLVDPTYSQTRILVKYGYEGAKAKHYMPTLNEITEQIDRSLKEHLPEAAYWIGGRPVEQNRILSALARSVGISILIFFPVVFCLLLFVFRSFKKAILPLIPAATSVMVYFGCMGWFNFPFNLVSNAAIATAMGVSVDDAIYYLLYYERRRVKSGVQQALETARKNTGTAIVQTTAIINACLLVLLFSTYRSVTQAGVMIIIGFTAATLVTLLVVPVLIHRVDRKHAGIKESDT
ncbi:MAG: MMPL family transporter, partial [Spirochaetales bacterium]|nr:MMPL family transporter [Spirochaetales bacterium]